MVHRRKCTLDSASTTGAGNNLSAPVASHLYAVSLKLVHPNATDGCRCCSCLCYQRQQNLLMPLVGQVICDSTFVGSCWISWFFNCIFAMSGSISVSSSVVISWILRSDCSSFVSRLCLWRDFQCRWFVSLRQVRCVFGSAPPP